MTDRSDADSDDDATRRDFMKTAGVASGAVVFGTGAAVAADDDDEHDDDNGDDGAGGDGDQAKAVPFASVEFSNQESNGTDVVVDSTVLSEAGYVAFHDATLLEGQVVESVVGVTEYHDAGIHYSTEASLFDVEGGEFERSALEGTTPLVAMPHRETDDDETYDFVASGGEEDGAFAEAGLPVVDLAFVTVTEDAMDDETPTPTPTGTSQDAEPESFASVDFANQALADGAVTVGETILSDGGFVTLHDARLLQGMPFESVVGVSEYLEPGRHRNVSVELEVGHDEITQVALPAPPLVPMPHMDTNDNQEYDFVTSEGGEDGPYTKAGQAVVDIGLVTPEPEGTDTPTDDGDN